MRLAFLALGLFSAASAGASPVAPLRVLATSGVLAELTRLVGGDDVEVETFFSGAQDPHQVEPREDFRERLSAADLLVRNGAGLEAGWLPPLALKARNPRIAPGGEGDFDASEGIELRDVPAAPVPVNPSPSPSPALSSVPSVVPSPVPAPSGTGTVKTSKPVPVPIPATAIYANSLSDAHPKGNPHFLLDPRNGIKIAGALARTLSKVRPTRAKEFQARAEKFSAELTGKMAKTWAPKLRAMKGVKIATYHATYSYFLNWAELTEAGTVERAPGLRPTPSTVGELATRWRAEHVRVLLQEDYQPSAISRAIAARSGARLAIVPGDAGGRKRGYVAFIEALVKGVAP